MMLPDVCLSDVCRVRRA